MNNINDLEYLLKIIGNHYGTFTKDNNYFYIDNGDKIYKYTKIKDGLCDWLDTMVLEQINNGSNWDEEIEIIFNECNIKGVRRINKKYQSYIDIQFDGKSKNFSFGNTSNLCNALNKRMLGVNLRNKFYNKNINKEELLLNISKLKNK